ncbi:MAG: cobalamin-dependent protein [Actinobacteria bacterium]|nr:cobalamin-dependent protein [Actinomycetota bacterium]
MKDLNAIAGSFLKNNHDELAEKIFEFYIKEKLKPQTSINPHEKLMIRTGVSSNLCALADGLYYSEQNIYENELEWARRYLSRIKIPVENITLLLEASRDIFEKRLPQKIIFNVLNYVDYGITVLKRTLNEEPSYLKEGNQLYNESVKYLEYILKKKKNSAIDMIFKLVNNRQNTIKDIYTHIFQPLHRELGRMWQNGQITTFHEQYAIAVTQLAMSQLYDYIFKKEKSGKSFLAACVSGELHEIGLRMISDLLALEGWTTFYLGSDTSIKTIIDTLENNTVSIIGLSVTVSKNLDESKKVIEYIRKVYDYEDLKIIVGGFVFNNSEDLWSRVGADSYANNACEAIDIITGF